MNTQKRTSPLLTIALIVGVVGIILFTLADRYLIEHVEIDLSEQTASASPTPAGIAAEPVALHSTLALQTTPVPAISDDWSYTSESVSIQINQVSTGSGENTVTYYVADVTLSDATDLAGAFADDRFGTNIIEVTSEIAADNNAVFAINGDYYGFRQDGIVIRNGVVYRDEPARVGAAFYQDGNMMIYDETQTSAAELVEQGVWNTLSFGPALIEDSQIIDFEGRVQIDTNVGNHSIQGNNPRTGIGIIAPNHYVFVVVDGRSKGYSRGVTLDEFTKIFADLGCTDAYNLDGGGSSTMYFMGRVVNNPLGRNKERGTSDILYIGY
ncbi:MAG: phosphodiester glycosidase family protein [Anaerolineaceae bacterium]|nr:phosphodiester glycosidase family protein [Anaerolineaceae bacterium]